MWTSAIYEPFPHLDPILLGFGGPGNCCHRRDITPTGLLGVRRCFFERTTAGKVNQQSSQQDTGIGKATGATQRTQQACLLLPARREELTYQLPVIQFLDRRIRFHPEKSTVRSPDG